MTSDISQSEKQSPKWSSNTKIIVTVTAVILIIALALRFTAIIRLLTIAAILAYLLNPLVVFIHTRTRLSRSAAIALVYLVLIIVVLGGATMLGVASYSQIVSFINQLPTLVTDFVNLLREWSSRPEPIQIGPFAIAPVNIDWDAVIDQVLGLVQPAATQSGRLLTNVATGTLTVLSQLFFIFILSIYLMAEIPKLSGYVVRLARSPGYQQDAERIMRYSSVIWSSYLRGQVILGLIIGFATGISLTVLGVQYSLALGIMAGLLEFVPNLGPIVTAVVAVVVALLQPENYWGLTNVQLALATLAIMVIIQQLENNILVPRVVGNALDLHPLLVLLGVLMGASLAGILGAILAAPLLASVKLVATYVWRKMFDLPPFATEDLPPQTPPAPEPPPVEEQMPSPPPAP
jgi:predicted PurR-regulated permease PerM